MVQRIKTGDFSPASALTDARAKRLSAATAKVRAKRAGPATIQAQPTGGSTGSFVAGTFGGAPPKRDRTDYNRRTAQNRADTIALQAKREAQKAAARARNAAESESFGGGGGSVTTYNQPPEQGTPASTQQAVAESLSGLVSSYNQAYGEARQANEQRYQQLLQIADQDYSRSAGIREQMLGVAGQTTGQRAVDIRSEGAQEESDVMQRLRSLGMSGTTIGPTQVGGVKSRTESRLNRLADTMQQTKLGIMREQAGATRGTRLGIMERREDPYPNRGELTGLISSIGTGYKGDLLPATLGALRNIGNTGAPRRASSVGGAPAGANTSLTGAQYRSKYGV